MADLDIVNPGATTPVQGSVGLQTQLPGQPTTVSGIADATGGMGGNFIEKSIDDELFEFEGAENTPLFQLMLKAKKKNMDSPVVQHPLIDEQRSKLTTQSSVSADTSNEDFELPLQSGDKKIPEKFQTLRCVGVDGYDINGTSTPGQDLMLYVIGKGTNGGPKCIAVNGPRTSSSAAATVPAIPAGTTVIAMGNALYETRCSVPPSSYVPTLMEQNLQKRGMTTLVSDYFESQKKKIPFGKSAQAEIAIKQFMLNSNKTLWGGQLGHVKVATEDVGTQDVYFTKGVRWQFFREFQHSGRWTYETLISLAKMFYCNEDKPGKPILLCGKNLLEKLQLIDFTGHSEVTINPMKIDAMGWVVTSIHTIFGDIPIKHDPTLDNSGWENSGALISMDRLVHYTRTTQHDVSERVKDEEATKNSTIVWDALCLKGTCHIWIDGDSSTANSGALVYHTYEATTTPTSSNVTDGHAYYFTNTVVLNSNQTAEQGSVWVVEVSGTTLTWTKYNGTMLMA